MPDFAQNKIKITQISKKYKNVVDFVDYALYFIENRLPEVNLRLSQYKSFGCGAFSIFKFDKPNRIGHDIDVDAAFNDLNVTNAVGVESNPRFFKLLNFEIYASLLRL